MEYKKAIEKLAFVLAMVYIKWYMRQETTGRNICGGKKG